MSCPWSLRQELQQWSHSGEGVVVGVVGEGSTAVDEEVETLMKRRPDLLAATQHAYQPHSGNTLMQEIAQKEGLASPLLRQEQVLLASPFLRSSRAGSMRKARMPVITTNLRSQATLSSSLPNLADIDSLDALAPANYQTNRFSVMLPSQ